MHAKKPEEGAATLDERSSNAIFAQSTFQDLNLPEKLVTNITGMSILFEISENGKQD